MKKVFAVALSVVVFVLAFSYSLGDVFWHPNSFQSDMSGDGLKNYYTFAYHLKHFDGWWFNGFLYPYGDYTLYTDNQIFVVWLLRGLSFLGIDLSSYSLGILNVLPLISFPIGSFYIYKIFRHYQVPFWPAIFLALICLLMSPQLFRLQGHFALAYACLLPMLWYAIIQYRERKTRWILIAMSVGLLICGFIHPYILLSMGLLLGSVVAAILVRSHKFEWKLFLPIAVAFGCFLLITKSTDHNAEYRPQNPWGAKAFKTEVSDIMPIAGNHNELLKPILALRQHYHEGYCYPSCLMLFSIAVLIIFLFSRYILRYRSIRLLSQPIERSLQEYFIAALFILAFSTGLHFILTGNYIFELVPPLRQFRGVGRMSWGFYYIAFVFFGVFIYRRGTLMSSLIIKSIFYTIIGLCLVYESFALLRLFQDGVRRYDSSDLLTTHTQLKDVLDAKGLTADDFQAIVTLPIGTEGAEKIGIKDDWDVKINALPLSYQTGLPMTTCILSRASLESVAKVLQLSNSEYGKIDIVEDMTLDKELLLVLPSKLTELYGDLIGKSTLIDSTEILSMYSIRSSQLKKRKFYDDYISEEAIDTFTNEVIFYQDYEENNELGGLLSKGARRIKNKKDTLLSKAIAADTAITTTLSLWFKLEETDSSLAAFIIKLYNQEGQEVYADAFRDWDMHRVEVYDRWVRYEREIPLWPSHSRLDILVESDNLLIDRLLILENGKHFSKATDDPNWLQVDHLLMRRSPSDDL